MEGACSVVTVFGTDSTATNLHGSLAALSHQGSEATEVVISIMRARTGLRVVLHAKYGLVAVRQCGHGAVIEIEMRHLHLLGRQGGGVDGESMVLAGDLHHTWATAGMIQTSVAISELVRTAAHGQAKNLMTEADAEHWEIAVLQ